MKSFMRVLCVSALFAGIAFTTGCADEDEVKKLEQLKKDLDEAPQKMADQMGKEFDKLDKQVKDMNQKVANDLAK